MIAGADEDRSTNLSARDQMLAAWPHILHFLLRAALMYSWPVYSVKKWMPPALVLIVV